MSDCLVRIRQAKADDAEALSRVFEAAWREAYRGIIPGLALEKMLLRRGEGWWRSTVSRGRPMAVLDLGQGVAGYASYGRCRNQALPADGEIDELYVLPECQGIGFGRRLFKAVLNDLKARDMSRVLLWALADNERACAFYDGLGGTVIARVEERIGGTALAKIAYLFR